MSAMLQDQGWDGDSIRVVLDDRATTAGVMERLHWLLGDVRAGEERVFYYSGHGAKLTQYNAEGEPDHHDEALVTWDFDWKKNCGITDDMLVSLYANLPYEAHVVFLLDCCHSGGMARSGSNPARGIDPPDDVAHRALRWDSTSQLWVRRNLDLSSKIRASDTGKAASFIGQDRATHRIGRAVSLWQQDPEATADEARRLGHAGPFNPTILASCAEGEYAYEYRHGVESHGAFTFVLTRMLTGKGAPPSLKTLVERAAKVMKVRLELQQHPALYNPGKAPNPFKPGGVERRPRRGT